MEKKGSFLKLFIERFFGERKWLFCGITTKTNKQKNFYIFNSKFEFLRLVNMFFLVKLFD